MQPAVFPARKKARDMLSENLLCRVTQDSLRTGVPTDHIAIGVEHVNGIVTDTVQHHAQGFFAGAQPGFGFPASHGLSIEVGGAPLKANFEVGVEVAYLGFRAGRGRQPAADDDPGERQEDCAEKRTQAYGRAGDVPPALGARCSIIQQLTLVGVQVAHGNAHRIHDRLAMQQCFQAGLLAGGAPVRDDRLGGGKPVIHL